MNIENAFPSKYLKAANLGGKTIRLKITNVVMEKLGDDERPVAYFTGTTKGLVLNKTNANVINEVYGSETDNWIGKDIDIYPTRVEYAGRMVDGMRVRIPAAPPKGKAGPAPGKTALTAAIIEHLDAPPPASEADYGTIGGGSLADDLDDVIPFAPEWR